MCCQAGARKTPLTRWTRLLLADDTVKFALAGNTWQEARIIGAKNRDAMHFVAKNKLAIRRAAAFCLTLANRSRKIAPHFRASSRTDTRAARRRRGGRCRRVVRSKAASCRRPPSRAPGASAARRGRSVARYRRRQNFGCFCRPNRFDRCADCDDTNPKWRVASRAADVCGMRCGDRHDDSTRRLATQPTE